MKRLVGGLRMDGWFLRRFELCGGGGCLILEAS